MFKKLLTKKSLSILLSLTLCFGTIQSTKMHSAKIKASYYPAVTSVYGVYRIGVDSNKETFGKIYCDNYFFTNAGVHPNREGFAVVAVIDTRETPNPKDDRLMYYRFPCEDKGTVHINYYPY